MRIVFRREAASDLRGIIDWYERHAPDSVGKILADIHRSIEQLRRYPRSGAPVAGRSFRRIVTLKYHFKVAYEIADDRIIVLGIFRYQNRQE